jgi:dienelactone hydrolase
VSELSSQTPTLDLEADDGALQAGPRGMLGRVLRTGALSSLVLALTATVVYFALVEHSTSEVYRPAAAMPIALDARMRSQPSDALEVTLGPEELIEGLKVLPGTLRVQRPGVSESHQIGFAFYPAVGVSERSPALVVTPILGGDNGIAKLLAKDLATHGFHAVIVDRRWSSSAGLGTTFEAVDSNLSDMIADRRRAVDWLLTRPDVDPKRIGAYGVSLGGITTVNLAASEPRVMASVVVMAGGDLPAVLCRSVERECVNVSRANGVPEGASDAQREAFEVAARKVIEADPYALAPYVDPASMLLFTTRRDTSVPSFLQERLREALGRPETYSLPTGHYSAIIYLPLILDRAREFLRRRFDAVE